MIYQKDVADALRTIAALLTVFLMFSISLRCMTIIHGVEKNKEAIADTRSEIYNAFKAVARAYNAGGDVGELVKRLNEALSLISKAEELLDEDPEETMHLSSEAQIIAQNVTLEAPNVEERGLQRKQVETVIMVGSSFGLVASGVLIYVYGPRIFWRIWVRLRRNYRVIARHSHSKSGGSMLVSGEVWAILLAAMVILAVFASSQLFFVGRVSEPFSELGVLGPRMKIGDYPKEVVAGETVKLYVYVGNHVGRPTYYVVMVKLGRNETEIAPAPIEPIMKFEKVSLQNETWIFPADIKLVKAGLNQRIIFELWTYNETSNKVEYNQRWCQVWINVTAPF